MKELIVLSFLQGAFTRLVISQINGELSFSENMCVCVCSHSMLVLCHLSIQCLYISTNIFCRYLSCENPCPTENYKREQQPLRNLQHIWVEETNHGLCLSMSGWCWNQCSKAGAKWKWYSCQNTRSWSSSQWKLQLCLLQNKVWTFCSS